MQPTLILKPAFTFNQICESLSRLGWARTEDTSVTAPIIPGEPEFASWSRPDGGRISYTFNPVVKLRVLVFYGPRAGEQSVEVEGVLPALGFPELRELLQSGDTRQLLLGIFAARELKAFAALDLLEPLRNHSETLVARAAQKAREELIQFAIEIGAERLREEKKRNPDRSVLFPHLGDAHMRRQTLRWLIHDYREANERITAVLRSGLVDEDWEVRATAMLAAARLGARELWSAIRHIELPKTTRAGPDSADRSILFALRKAALDHLEGKPLPELDSNTGEQAAPDDVIRRMRLNLAGLSTDRSDRLFLLSNALTQPLDLEGPVPELPSAIIEEQGEYRLKHSGLPLCWIAPIPHWLGADDEDLPMPNPIRQETPPAGFFITKYPLTVAASEWIKSGSREGDGVAGQSSENLFLCRRLEALSLCERLGQIEGLSVSLPTADQWEMAARGPDGRRYPWGNGFEGDPNRFASPWGVEKQIGGEPEWTGSLTLPGVYISCGGDTDLRCASRTSRPADSSHTLLALRPVVLLSQA